VSVSNTRKLKMATPIYVSQDVIQNSVAHVGDALIAFARASLRQGQATYKYQSADIYITAKGGILYLMSLADTKRPKVPFMPFPTEEVAQIGELLRRHRHDPHALRTSTSIL